MTPTPNKPIYFWLKADPLSRLTGEFRSVSFWRGLDAWKPESVLMWGYVPKKAKKKAAAVKKAKTGGARNFNRRLGAQA
jgi:hypothetical protein